MLSLPISVPLWIGWLAMLLAGIALRDLFRPLGTFWHAPPRPLDGGYYRAAAKDRSTARHITLSMVDRDAA